MMRSLFRAFEREGVRYLVISGQACILYGASQFTEDLDLWIAPAPKNIDSLLRALARVKARVYKLTPPITARNVLKGHGFHFRIGRDLFIDVMGRPPRVGSFRGAFSRAREFRTDWGMLPVSAPEDLVLLKRTNRPGDYDAVSNLVRVRVLEDKDDTAVLRWALLNTFDVVDLAEFALLATGKLVSWPSRPALRALLPAPARSSRFPERRVQRAARLLAIEMGEIQERGRRYWRPIVAELKKLQVDRRLIPEGTPVASLLGGAR
jgi:hypothetical protein